MYLIKFAISTVSPLLFSVILIFAFFSREATSFVPSSSSSSNGNAFFETATSKNTQLWVSTSPPPPSSSDPEALLQRTAAQLERMKRRQQQFHNYNHADGDGSDEDNNNNNNEFSIIYQRYLMQPANFLKKELKHRNLPERGRKPDLARRLAEYDLRKNQSRDITAEEEGGNIETWNPTEAEADDDINSSSAEQKKKKRLAPLQTFCGLNLSTAASQALGRANFRKPTPIQKSALPSLVNRESLILHAETGSGKTLAYLLPLTEQLWLEHNEDIEDDAGFGFILTPSRELAAQVAGVATVLAPPGSVRMVSKATDLMDDGLRDKGEERQGGILDQGDGRTRPRLFIGSAKAIMHSLYGDGKMPASPTRKPAAMNLLKNTRWVILDEVDRLLATTGKKKRSSGSRNRHEKPAAVVTSSVVRLSLGKAQIVAASATVGRSLKRELSRVLGLEPRECPRVICASNNIADDDDDVDIDDDEKFDTTTTNAYGQHIGRAVKIPETVQHYVTAVDTSSVGKLLTNAFYVLKALNKKKNHRRILFVLTKNCGVSTKNAIGALKHFGCQPDPISLLDALEADGTNQMIETHRQVSGATGIGESSYFSDASDDNGKSDHEIKSNGDGYLLVTGEDTIRGLHLDGLDMVVVVGRPNGPDEYTHIAGRTGRAGRPGKVINVLSEKDAAALSGWEKMLDVTFDAIETDGIAELD